jgi:hypothetical protein
LGLRLSGSDAYRDFDPRAEAVDDRDEPVESETGEVGIANA